MAKVLINESTLQDIADAIREKTESNDTFLPSAMGAAIRAMESGNAEGIYCWEKFASDPLVPYGYTHVEYLESSGTQVINTGIVPTPTTRVVGTMMSNNAGFMFGSETAWTSNSFGIVYNSSGKVLYFLYGSQTWTTSTLNGTMFELDWSGTSVKANGATIHTFTAATFNSGLPMYLFGDNRAGNISEPAKARFYSGLKVYQNGTTLSGNFITCLDAGGVPCMYDTVGKTTHYNIGSGTFAHGNALAAVAPVAYVVSNSFDYPDDDFASDGYYYRRLDTISAAYNTMTAALNELGVVT